MAHQSIHRRSETEHLDSEAEPKNFRVGETQPASGSRNGLSMLLDPSDSTGTGIGTYGTFLWLSIISMNSKRHLLLSITSVRTLLSFRRISEAARAVFCGETAAAEQGERPERHKHHWARSLASFRKISDAARGATCLRRNRTVQVLKTGEAPPGSENYNSQLVA